MMKSVILFTFARKDEDKFQVEGLLLSSGVQRTVEDQLSVG
ncbi:MAG TPA: hypothetical protein VIP70_04120 [Nitrososphaeraceae archaeon]